MTWALFLGNMLRARKYRFALCFQVLSNQYVERSAHANVFKCSRENKRCERAKVNSRCFHWFPAAMLESFRRAPGWRFHTKPYNFQSSKSYFFIVRGQPASWVKRTVGYRLQVCDVCNAICSLGRTERRLRQMVNQNGGKFESL